MASSPRGGGKLIDALSAPAVAGRLRLMWPANRAVCNNLVLALILRYRRWTNVASALRYFTGRPKAAIKALLAPG